MNLRILKAVFGVLLGLCTGFFASTANALVLQVDPDSLKKDYPDSYTVKESDTLWDVSGVFLRTPWGEGSLLGSQEVPELFPGDKVSVIDQGGSLFLQFKHNREVILSPSVRVPRAKRAIDILPLNSIRQFLNRPKLITNAEIQSAAYILDSPEDRMLLTFGDLIYARNLPETMEGTGYTIIRRGQPYDALANQDNSYNDTGELYEAVYLGEATVKREGDPTTLTVVNAEREIRVGDILLSTEDRRFEQDFRPHSPGSLEGAEIMAVVDGVSEIGQYQVVVINKGEQDGMENGFVLGVFKGGRKVKDTVRAENDDSELVLPREQSGVLLVFRVFDTLSYALVMQASRSIHIHDIVDKPE